MLQIKNILFPTDYSVCAEHAFTHAAFLADWHEARLHILNVVEAEGDEEALLSGLPFSEEEIAEQLQMIGEDGKRGTASGDARPEIVQKQVQAASVPEALLRYVEEHDIDLIVMGTHGRRGVRRLLLGSVAEKVVHRSRCVVREEKGDGREASGESARRILVPVEFVSLAAEVFRYARELAALNEATLDVLHVVDILRHADLYHAGLRNIREVEVDLEKKARQRLEEIYYKTGGPDVSVTLHARVGHPAKRIVEFAERTHPMLIVIASHGRSDMERFLLGSTAERVLRGAPAPFS